METVNRQKEVSTEMYSYEQGWARERMAQAIKDREQDRLGRELRLAAGASRGSIAVRGVALVMALFRA
ncbi:MAG: hypothetical protein H0T91_01665 [Propionibacteriaceae bacterium]|nr:hypothetical protein [Propionibacteriaceae bacterium]